jgi:hypothetical protein
MQHFWAFAIALDGGNKSSVPYLVYRLCFVLGHKLLNEHMIACPMYKSQTGETCLILVARSYPHFAQIGQKSSLASQPMEQHAGLGTSIEKVANAGFFRIWCAAHQLDLVVQARFNLCLMNRLFMSFKVLQYIYDGKRI